VQTLLLQLNADCSLLFAIQLSLSRHSLFVWCPIYLSDYDNLIHQNEWLLERHRDDAQGVSWWHLKRNRSRESQPPDTKSRVEICFKRRPGNQVALGKRFGRSERVRNHIIWSVLRVLPLKKRRWRGSKKKTKVQKGGRSRTRAHHDILSCAFYQAVPKIWVYSQLFGVICRADRLILTFRFYVVWIDWWMFKLCET